MPKITIKKYARVCPWNDKIDRGEGENKRIYDYAILIDGVKRADFKLWMVGSRRYQLVDLKGRPIRIPGNSYFGHNSGEADHVGSSKDFQAEVERLLAYFPTDDDYAQYEIEQRQEEKRKLAEEAAHRREDRIERVTPAMLHLVGFLATKTITAEELTKLISVAKEMHEFINTDNAI